MSSKTPQTTRRVFLGGTAGAAALAGFSSLAQSPDTRPDAQAVPLDDYSPEFLSAAEWTFLMAATARIIPSEGDGPGALETGVPIFIDRQLAGEFGTAADLYMEGPFVPDAAPQLGIQSPLTPAEMYRQAIPAFDEWCQRNAGAAFHDLDADAQDSALQALADGDTDLAPELREFWSLLLQNTREGYFADPMYGGNAGMQSWIYIGYPGARANYLEWIGRDEPYPLGPVNIAGERA